MRISSASTRTSKQPAAFPSAGLREKLIALASALFSSAPTARFASHGMLEVTLKFLNQSERNPGIFRGPHQGPTPAQIDFILRRLALWITAWDWLGIAQLFHKSKGRLTTLR